MSLISVVRSRFGRMDGRDGSGLSSYFNTHHHHLVDGSTTSASDGKGIFSAPPSSAAGDANPFFIPHTVSTRPSAARPSVATAAAAHPVKRKRGRPRKYGTLPSPPPLSLPTSAMSAAAKVSPSTLRSTHDSSSKKKELSSSNSSARKAQLAALGNAGQGFTPHVVTVSAGEDVVHKIVSMMQQGKRAFSILSATGSILNPSLRQPAASSAGLTYEGKFEIISLSGSLIYNKVGGAFSRTSGLVVCLSSVDGSIVGGAVEGPLMADGPVQVIAGSFLIDANRIFSAHAKVEDYTNNISTAVAAGATLASPVSSGSSLGPSRRMIASRRSDDHQSMGGSHYLFQSQPLFSSLDWEGRHISGHTGTCQSADDEDEEDIGD